MANGYKCPVRILGAIPDLAYKTSKELLQNLVDVVAKMATFCSNIGPKADGTIPEQDQDILTEIGDWLAVNGGHLSESALAGVIGRTDRAQEGSFSGRASATLYQPRFPLYTMRDGFLLCPSSWNQVEGRKS